MIELREPRFPEDREAVVRLYAETARLHGESWPQDYRIPESAAAFGALPENGKNLFFQVAVVDGAVEGLISASLSPKPQGGLYRYDGPIVYIGDVVVTAAARRTGIGSQLMRAAESWAREKGAATVHLHVHVGNSAAQALYDHEGYRRVDIHMRKDLD